MKTLLVSGSDTGIGKTHVVGALARLLRERGASVRIVKPVETGRSAEDLNGDALSAAFSAGLSAENARTPLRFAAPLAPLAAARAEGRPLDWAALIDGVEGTPACDWRILEGAGGIAVPLAEDGRDWADFAVEIGADVVVLVVPDRLGAINQARLALSYALARGLNAGLWLNACVPVDPDVAASNRGGLREAGAVRWGETRFEQREAWLSAEGELAIAERKSVPDHRPTTNGAERWERELATRAQEGLQRRVRRWAPCPSELNLAGNDYLELARDPALAEAMAASARAEGASASASPLISGWRHAHDELVAALCAWHGFAEGLVWTSGFAANAGVLGTLPRAGDLVLADRLIHHSMVAGVRKSGARLQRFPHLDLDALERMLVREARSGAGRAVFVATESVFSMDGDSPDLRRLAALRRRFGFCWILDEAHALGWYGRSGAGLAEEKGVVSEVDVLVGTCGKALGAGGAYTLFHGGPWRDALVNHAGEFIYSTGLPPPVAAAARVAIGRVRELAAGQSGWRDTSRAFRACLRATGWTAAEGDSPIVPVVLGDPSRALVLAGKLREAGVLAAAVRPPTVPAGTSRLRFSLTRNFGAADALRVMTALGPEGTGR